MYGNILPCRSSILDKKNSFNLPKKLKIVCRTFIRSQLRDIRNVSGSRLMSTRFWEISKICLKNTESMVKKSCRSYNWFWPYLYILQCTVNATIYLHVCWWYHCFVVIVPGNIQSSWNAGYPIFHVLQWLFWKCCLLFFNYFLTNWYNTMWVSSKWCFNGINIIFHVTKE